MRASPAVKRHSTLVPGRFRSASQALVSRPSVSTSASRLSLRRWRTNAEIPISAMFSHDPRAGVRKNPSSYSKPSKRGFFIRVAVRLQ